MGVYSSVGIVMTKGLAKAVTDKASKGVLELLSEADTFFEGEQHELYVYDYVKWYDYDPEFDCAQLTGLLKEENPDGENYYIVKITNDEAQVWGEMEENEFDLGSKTSGLSLSYCV